MSNKTLLKYLSVLVFVGIIAFSGFRIYKDNKPKEEYIFNEKTGDPEKDPVSEIEETKDEYIILTKVSYNGSYRTTKRLYSTGRMDQSTTKEETTISNQEQEKYVAIGSMTDEDLAVVKETIESMSKEKFKREDFSDSHGISLRLKPKDKVLYIIYFYPKNYYLLYGISLNIW